MARNAFLAWLIGLIAAVTSPAGVTEAELKVLFSVRVGDSKVDITRVAACGSGLAAAGHQALTASSLGRGFQDSDPTSDILVARLDELGHVLWTATLAGSASDSLGGLVCDAEGNVLIAGSTQSFDLPVLAAFQPTNPNASTRLANHSCGFFAKLDSGGQRRFAGYLCGEGSTGINAISLDTDGSILLAGSTNSLDFPTTPGAFISSPLQVPNTTITYAFVSRFDPDGKRLLSSTLLGGTSPHGLPGSALMLSRGGSGARAVLSDGAGGVLVAGTTSNVDFPVTEDAFQRSWSSFSSNAGFLSKLSRDGRSLLWSTYLSGDPQSPRPQNGSVIPQSLLIDAEGAVWVGGYTHHPDFPVTGGALQSSYHEARDKSGQLIPSGFLTAFQPDGRGLKFSTYLGGEGGEVTSLTAGAGQAMWVTGLWEGKGFLLRFPDLAFLRLPEGVIGESAARAGDEVYVGGGAGARVLRLGAAGQTTPELLAIGNAAAAAPSGRVAVNEVISLYGLGLGPEKPAVASLAADGTLPTNLDGFRLFFDGVAAELLYADRRQINAICPPGFFTNAETVLDLVQDDRIVLTRKLAVVPAEVEVFADSVANEDGTLNFKDNPARPGSTVTALTTGNGDLPIQATLAERAIEVEATPVLGLGRAPLRLSLRLPQGAAGSLPFQVTSGGSTSAVVSIFVQ